MMFNSPNHALKFAFRVIASPICKTSSIQSGVASHSDLTQHDKHAQAAMIMSLVERVLSNVELAYIKAEFGHVLKVKEYDKDVLETLRKETSSTLPTGFTQRRAAEKLVMMYFGRDISMVSTRSDMRCRHDTLVLYKTQVAKELDQIGSSAMERIAEAMESGGLINCSIAA